MTYDPRPIANAMLDIAQQLQLPLTNVDINKILYFSHASHLAFFRKPLLRLSFEAWQFGPVMPVIYHQFKKHGRDPITTRATIMCAKTGADIEADYTVLDIDDSWLAGMVEHYGNMSSGALIALSHEQGGAWDLVWNGDNRNRFGMSIPDKLIEQTFLGRLSDSSRRSNVH